MIEKQLRSEQNRRYYESKTKKNGSYEKISRKTEDVTVTIRLALKSTIQN